MKKRFLKVSFFCLLMACLPATFTSCKDYDDDIAVLTKQTGSLESQVNTLKEALNANKESAAQAAQAAADAMAAAQAAQSTADQALEEAKAAQARGDEALAVAKAADAAAAAAQADALNALAAAELAKEAAATAKSEAIEEVMEQVKELMNEQRALTEKELAEIAGKIEGIEKGLNELSGALEGVNSELEGVKNEINVVADELTTLKTAVEVQKAAFEEFQTLINGKIETLESNYANLLETVQGIESTVASLTAADEAIKEDINELTSDLAAVEASVAANKLLIETINERIDAIENLLDALDKKIDDTKSQLLGYTDAEVAELREDLMGVISVIESTLNGKIDLINKNINSIQGDITSINDQIAGIKGDVSSIKDQIASINDQITSIKGDIDRLSGFIKDLNDKIDEINKQIESLNAKIEAINGQIGDIQGSLDAHSLLISSLGDKLNDVVNTLVTVFAERLTSVTLMPDAYANGIPCIDFSTAVFKEMTGSGDDWEYADAKEIRVTPYSIPVSYRLSPKSVNQNTIEAVNFVEKTASVITRGGSNDCILKVEGFTVENGILTVNAAKNNDVAVNKTSDGKINIAALRVNQKATKLGAETLEGAEVHSEYARVTEGVFTPSLAEIASPANHLSLTPRGAEEIAKIPYDSTLNLASIVSVCKNVENTHVILEESEMVAYQLNVEFALAESNDKVWAQVENGIFTPGFVNDEGTFDAHNKKASKRHQICRATLKHGEKVVDVKFFVVYIEPSKSEELTVALEGHTSAISCDPETDYSFTITWREFTKVLNHENIRLYGSEFLGVYSLDDMKVLYKFNGEEITDAVPAIVDLSTNPENSYAWGFTFTENIDVEYFKLNIDEPTKLDIEVICTPNYLKEDTYPVLTVTTSLTIEPLRESLATVVNQNQTYWKQDGEKFADGTFKTLRVLPIQYNTPNPATHVNPATCEYYYPIQQAFMTEGPLVNFNERLSECGKWDLMFAENGTFVGTYEDNIVKQPTNFFGAKSTNYQLSNLYVLARGTYTSDPAKDDKAMAIRWSENHNPWDETNFSNHFAYLEVLNRPAGIELVNQKEKVALTFMAEYPNGQQIPVRTYELEIVKPLNFGAVEFEGYFVDGAQAGQEGSEIETYDQFNITDFRNVLVNRNSPLYDYYGISSVKWHTDETVVGLKSSGAVSSYEEVFIVDENNMKQINTANTMKIDAVPNANMSLTYDETTGKLIYLNHGGVNVEKEYYLVVPVSITHKWGEAKTAVVIPVKPGVIKNKRQK